MNTIAILRHHSGLISAHAARGNALYFNDVDGGDALRIHGVPDVAAAAMASIFNSAIGQFQRAIVCEMTCHTNLVSARAFSEGALYFSNENRRTALWLAGIPENVAAAMAGAFNKAVGVTV